MKYNYLFEKNKNVIMLFIIEHFFVKINIHIWLFISVK